MSSQPGKLSFTGHETFPFRFPWPAKGVRGVLDDPELFDRDNALVTLGVGKNMVRSIRYWCETLGLIERERPDSRIMKVTELGSLLFGPTGWDPFIENPGTPWLLHWQLVRRRERASAWHLVFTQHGSNRFTRDQLVYWLVDVASKAGTRATQASIRRDVNVLIRTYVPTKSEQDSAPEEAFDSPLVQLGLVNEIDNGVYSFSVGPKPTLPDEIFLYAILDFWMEAAGGANSLAFEKALWGPGSPGASFKLSASALAELLEHLSSLHEVVFDETAGMRTVYLEPGVMNGNLLQVLRHYYQKGRSKTK